MIQKATSYFNIFECGRNRLDQRDVTYQWAFMASPVQEGFYQPSPGRERYYDKMAESLIKAKVGSDETINNYEIHKAITLLKSEKEAEHERNILDMTQVDDYKSPWKDKDALTFNDSAYTFFNPYEDEISDSSKQVESSKEPITDNHIVDRVCNFLDGTISVHSDVTSDAKVVISTPNLLVHEWGTHPTMIYPTVSNFTRRAYVPITTQKGFCLRCNHERLRLKRVERKRIALENHLARICQDIRDDVAANYACSLANHALDDATFPSSNDSDSGDG